MATITKEYAEQIKSGNHPQFVYDKDKGKVVCRCGHAAVMLRSSFMCGTITAYPCKYN